MRNSLARGVIALLLTQSFASPALVSAQQETRPRRTQTQVSPAAQQAARAEPVPPREWQPPTAGISEMLETASATKSEPTIRVALATDVRTATVSSSGHLLNATDEGNPLVAMDVSRVRLEPRLLSPLPTATSEDTFQIQLAGLASRAEAEQKAREVTQAANEDSRVIYDDETKTWGLLIGTRHSEIAAEESRARLEAADLQVTVTPISGAPTSAKSLPTDSSKTATLRQASAKTDAEIAPPSQTSVVRPAARYSLPSREVVALAPGAGRLFSSSAPVLFATDSETTPVRFNDRPYRGRIEVFANTRGALTVVNVLGLEDYVRGVVPNELSAGGFPLLEAHKAQAIAARTYALRNRGQFMAQGYDLLPTTRSQVYRGLVSENSLSSRAVDETRGIIATYNGEPINALYTSTCGGRTEDAENIFNDKVPYLRARECAAEGRTALAPFTIRTTRDPAELKEEQNITLARDVALLSAQNFGSLRSRVSDSWLNAEAPAAEVRSWLASVAKLTHQLVPAVTEDVNLPPAFATALAMAVFGESRASTLLNDADVAYFLAMRDGADIPAGNRADVALFVRDGYLALLPDATLHPRDPLSRARALHAITRILEGRSLLQLQKGTARPTMAGSLVLRSNKGKDLPVKVTADAFLFRQIGESIYPMRAIALVGGEPVVFHVNADGEVDYLEVRPAPNGAAADRFSPFANWTTELSLGQAQARLGRYASGIGPLLDLRVTVRGKSRRATDLEVVGTSGIRQVLGGRIRSALGLREQLFVIERKYDDSGRVIGFAFLGRGWGHGVGLCQVGAYGLAKQGFTYDQILKAYYTGIELTRIY